MRTQFEQELEEVRNTAGRMGSLVEAALHSSIDALLRRDTEKAATVIAGDVEINDLHHRLRESIFMVISTQQPVARDLRLVLGVQYIGAELERIGDYVVRIAKRARRLANEPEAPTATQADLGRMSDLVERQIHDILDAFIRLDKESAMAVAARDDAIDRLYRKVFADQLSAIAEDPEHAMRAQTVLNIAHTLERIGDRVTNVAEDIVYLDSGQVVELD
jgi:phosphate transport system protein